MTPDEAIALLHDDKCPVCGAAVHVELEPDEDLGEVAVMICAGSTYDRHWWPVASSTYEYDINYFEVELDPDAIADRLAEYTTPQEDPPLP